MNEIERICAAFELEEEDTQSILTFFADDGLPPSLSTPGLAALLVAIAQTYSHSAQIRLCPGQPEEKERLH